MNDSKQIKVAVADDHTVIRYALKGIIQKSENCIVVAESTNHDSTMQILGDEDIDIVFLDISWPGLSGLETINQAREKYPALKIIVYSMHDEETFVQKAILSGANGYITKDAGINEILPAVKEVSEGKLYLQNKLEHLRPGLEKKLKHESKLKDGRNKTDSKDFTNVHPLDKLSKREREVFYMLSEGQANRYIAKKMFLSPRTVETHRARILKKLTLNSTVDLVRFAIKNNLLSL